MKAYIICLFLLTGCSDFIPRRLECNGVVLAEHSEIYTRNRQIIVNGKTIYLTEKDRCKIIDEVPVIQ